MTTKVRLTPKPSGSTRLSGQFIDFLLRSQKPYILHATNRRRAGDGHTIIMIIYEISQLFRLCGAHSGSPQLALYLSHNSCKWAIAEKYLFHIYYWTDSSTSNRYTTSTLNIVIEAFGNHSSNLAVYLYKQPPCSWFPEKWDISLCYGLRWAVQSRLGKVISRQAV